MDIYCIKCEKTIGIVDERLSKVAQFVKENKLKGDAYLRYFNLAEGYACLGDKEHEFSFDADFDQAVHTDAKQCNDAIKANEESQKKQKELEALIEKTKLEIQQEIVKQQELKEIQEVNHDTLEIKTGNKDATIWL